MYKWFYFGGMVMMVVLAIFLIQASISYGRTDAWLTRAKDAGNPAQVAEFLSNYKASLEDRGLVAGKYYSVWKYPATDMPTYVRVIDGLSLRAKELAKQNYTDESYQMGLINLEKDLGDIDARAFSVWFAHGGYLIVFFVVITGVWSALGWAF